MLCLITGFDSTINYSAKLTSKLRAHAHYERH